jgi:hypothetical protein
MSPRVQLFTQILRIATVRCGSLIFGSPSFLWHRIVWEYNSLTCVRIGVSVDLHIKIGRELPSQPGLFLAALVDSPSASRKEPQHVQGWSPARRRVTLASPTKAAAGSGWPPPGRGEGPASGFGAVYKHKGREPG